LIPRAGRPAVASIACSGIAYADVVTVMRMPAARSGAAWRNIGRAVSRIDCGRAIACRAKYDRHDDGSLLPAANRPDARGDACTRGMRVHSRDPDRPFSRVKRKQHLTAHRSMISIYQK